MINFLKLLAFLLLMGMVLFSCNSSSEEKKPYVALAIMDIEIDLQKYERKVSDLITGEIFTDIDYTMDNVESLVLVVHSATTGKYVYAANIPKSTLEKHTISGLTKLGGFSFPFDKYHVTFMVTTENYLSHNLLNPMTKDYDKAAFQVPNEHIFYNTFELGCLPEGGMLPELVKEDIRFELKATLRCITGEYVFSVNEIDQIPTNAKFSIEAKVINIPAAIFVKDGTTLTAAQATSLQMHTFESKRRITNIGELKKSSIVAKVYCLTNSHLDEKDRGTISFVFMEDATSSVETLRIDKAIPKREDFNGGYYDMTGLFSGKGEVIPIEPDN